MQKFDKTGAWESASRERRKIRVGFVSKSKVILSVQKAAEGIFRSLIVWSRDHLGFNLKVGNQAPNFFCFLKQYFQ